MAEGSIPRPSHLWKSLSPERKTQAADAFWRDENAAAEQAEAVAAIAQRLKFRPKSAMALPAGTKTRYLLSLPALPEMVAARLLVAYHLEHQRPMMGSFLDALGVRHEHGLIEDEGMAPPDAERLKEAAAALARRYPADDVALYLSTLLWQDPDTWGGLFQAPEILTAAKA